MSANWWDDEIQYIPMADGTTSDAFQVEFYYNDYHCRDGYRSNDYWNLTTHFYNNMVLGEIVDATNAVRVLKFGYNERGDQGVCRIDLN